MSDLPRPGEPGEELDFGEIEDGEIEDGEGAEGGADEGDGGDAVGDEEGQEEGPDDVEPAPRRRGSDTIRQLRRRAQEAERERDRLRDSQVPAWAQPLLQQRQGPDPAELARQQQAENERLAMMSPAEVAQYYYQKGQQQVQQALLFQQVSTQDLIDKSRYDDRAETSRFHRDNRTEVERRFALERQNGNFRATRSDILAQIIGEQAMARASQAAPAQRRAAARRVAGQQTRPTNGRGDGSSGRGRPAPGSAEADDALIDEAVRNGVDIFRV